MFLFGKKKKEREILPTEHDRSSSLTHWRAPQDRPTQAHEEPTR